MTERAWRQDGKGPLFSFFSFLCAKSNPMSRACWATINPRSIRLPLFTFRNFFYSSLSLSFSLSISELPFCSTFYLQFSLSIVYVFALFDRTRHFWVFIILIKWHLTHFIVNERVSRTIIVQYYNSVFRRLKSKIPIRILTEYRRFNSYQIASD